MKKKKKISIRLFTQIVFFVLIGLIAINKGLAESGIGIPLLSSASLHSLCPYGGVETFVSLITAGTIVKKVHESAVVLMVIVLILTILVGPVFCGWVCPLGSIQEWVGKMGRKIFKKKYNNFIPVHVDKYLRLLRYVTLIWTVYLTTESLKLVFVEIDPYYALFKFWSEEATIGGIIVLLITLLLSLFVERPWCKYACPYGGLLGLFNKIRIFKIKRNTSTCISCGKCDNACPMNIKVSQQEVVKSTQCISCLKCTSENTCPVENTVQLTSKREVTK